MRVLVLMLVLVLVCVLMCVAGLLVLLVLLRVRLVLVAHVRWLRYPNSVPLDHADCFGVHAHFNAPP